MTLPYLATTIRDPGLAKVKPTQSVALVLGTTSSGTANTVTTYNSSADLIAAVGYGYATEVATAILTFGGGPIRFVKVTQNAAGTVVTTPCTKSGSGPDISDNSSTPYDNYEVRIVITTGGALGTSRFKYSLDGGRTYSPIITTAATYTIPNSGVSLTWAAGTYVANDVYTTTTTGPTITGTELATAIAAVKSAQVDWDFGVLAGRPATAAAATTLAAALTVGRATLSEPYKNKPWLCDIGADNVATTQTDWASTDRWISGCYSWVTMATSCPVVGRAMPKLPVYVASAIKAASELISTHFGRVASGPLTAMAAWSTDYGVPIGHDEFLTGGLDDYRVTTVRSLEGAKGYYITRQAMSSAVGSDFVRWEHARIFAETHRVVHEQELLALNRSWAVKADGTLAENEAAAFEAVVNAAIKNVLHQKNAEGTLGHCSIVDDDPGFYYTLSRTQNVLATSQIVTEWGVRPRGYSEYITTTGGFAAETVTVSGEQTT